MPAKPTGARAAVTPRMTRRKKEEGHRHLGHEARGHVVLARRGVAVAVRRQALRREVPAGLARGDGPEEEGAGGGADDLRGDVGQRLAGLEPPGRDQVDCDRRVEVAAADVADGVGHGQHRQAEGKRDADEADPDLGEFRGEHRAAAATQDKPERAEEFGRELPRHDAGPPKGGFLPRVRKD
jgi:hypothetical protein